MNTQTMTAEQELALLRAENAKLKAMHAPKEGLALKVSAKGALSVYGLGRFPVTLYKSQWLKLISASERIQEFIKANEDALAEKAEK